MILLSITSALTTDHVQRHHGDQRVNVHCIVGSELAQDLVDQNVRLLVENVSELLEDLKVESWCKGLAVQVPLLAWKNDKERIMRNNTFWTNHHLTGTQEEAISEPIAKNIILLGLCNQAVTAQDCLQIKLKNHQCLFCSGHLSKTTSKSLESIVNKTMSVPRATWNRFPCFNRSLFSSRRMPVGVLLMNRCPLPIMGHSGGWGIPLEKFRQTKTQIPDANKNALDKIKRKTAVSVNILTRRALLLDCNSTGCEWEENPICQCSGY